MTKLKHNNLFASGDRKKEVYAALQRDFNRDSHIHGLWHAGIFFPPQVLFILQIAPNGYGYSAACMRQNVQSQNSLK